MIDNLGVCQSVCHAALRGFAVQTWLNIDQDLAWVGDSWGAAKNRIRWCF